MLLACARSSCPKSLHLGLTLLLFTLLIAPELKPRIAIMAKWVEIGKDIGLKGTELMEFVRGREKVERDDRAQKMDLAKAEREAYETQLKIRELELKSGKEQKHDAKAKPTGKIPKLPVFQDDKDDLDSYLNRFERYAESQSWPKQNWAINLSALLTGKALSVYSRIPTDEADDYYALKVALFKQYNLTEDGFRAKFRQARPDKLESPSQFAVRLENHFDRWVELAKVGKSYAGLKNLMLREQYLNSCNPDLSVFLRERTPPSVEQMAKLAEQFIEARGTTFGQFTQPERKHVYQPKATSKPESSRFSTTSKERPTLSQTPQVRTCFICHKKGHIARDCYHRAKPPVKASSMVELEDAERKGDKATVTSSSSGGECTGLTGKTVCCCTCHKPESQETVAFMVSHSLENCCRDDDHVTLRCGHQLPIMSAACRDRKLSRMPVCEGLVGDQKVSVLRDSGCSGVVIRKELISSDSLTGEDRVCVLIDGTIRKVPVATVVINTPFYQGSVEALCMEHPVYDVILGNIPGVRGPADPNPDWSCNLVSDATNPQCSVEKSDQIVMGAVQTRAQKLAESRPVRVLKVPSCLVGVVTAEDLQTEQEADPTLQRCRELVGGQFSGKGNHTSRFLKRSGILYREFQAPTVDNNNAFLQVVVPSKYRSEVMKLAHESLLGGHLGSQKTCDRVLTNFFWPGIQSSVRRFAQSCDICQRTFPKGKVKKLPLGSLPLIETPFERVAVDIIGPIHPATDRGNRFILTIVDYATRYPEAVPLRSIETTCVAEALVDVFTRVGIPREILSDQGTQFMSGLMREVSRLLSVKQLTTTPYHPACNGLVERFNGTLKQMLRKMSTERPKDWDRYVGALLFAYREAPQASLGFSPFELLYGRTIRGPMSILKELWTGEVKESQVKTTYEYVLDLKNRLQETCQLARENLKKAQRYQKKYYDKNSKDRRFKVGDSVLLLLPTDKNKLLLQWKGPYPVVSKQGNWDYQIDVNGTVKTFHANLLKAYIHREETASRVDEDLVYGCVAVIGLEHEDDGEIQEELLQSPVLKATETVSSVKLDPKLTSEQREDVNQLFWDYSDVLTDLTGRTTAGEHDIKLTTDEPIRSKPYPIPFALKDTVKEEISNMLKLKVIEPSESPYASPIVLVDKKDGTKRFCIDFRALNRITIFDAEPVSNPDEIFFSLAHDKYFSKFDLTKGYWQVPVHEKARPATAFLTPEGLFQFCTMPFGLVNAPATFSRLMRRVLKDLPCCDNYIDDILIHTQSWDQHLAILKGLFERLRSANLTAKPSKCLVGAKSLDFLGHVVGQGILQPQSDKVESIMEADIPKTKKQLRSFLGLAGYYRRFIPNFAAVAVPLTDLTKAKEPTNIKWGESQKIAFSTLKTKLSSSPILQLPDCSRPFVLRTDASNTGVGAVLLQENEQTGELFPVAYASRKLLPRERAYATIEKEGLAIVWGIQKFQRYLYGREFVLQTDHQSLGYLNKAKLANARVMRWALALQPYRFRIDSIKGSENVGADFLSRSEVKR